MGKNNKGLNKKRIEELFGGSSDDILNIISRQENENISIDKGKIIEIEINKITPNPYQPRKIFKEEEIVELANSIEKNGLINPIVVKKDEDKYILISGERRLRAFEYLGKETIPARILEIDDKGLFLLSIVENLQRVDLTDIEKGESFKKLKEKFKLKDEEIANLIGISRASVTNYIRLTKLPDYIKKDLLEKKVSMGQIKPIITLSEKEMESIYSQIVKKNLTAREVENLVRNIKNKGKKIKNIEDNTFLNEIKNKIENNYPEIKKLKLEKTKKGLKISFIISEDDISKIFKDLDKNEE